MYEPAMIVASISQFDEAGVRTRRLGACHSGYGVTYEHYEATGPVLLDALDDTLGSAYTDEVRDAWRLPLDLLAETMI